MHSTKRVSYFIYVLLLFVMTNKVLAVSGEEYMIRFNAFRQWNQNLPINPSPEFFEFIKGDAPLSVKLREKWLYELAKKKDWLRFLSHYEPTKDANLLCYQAIARYEQGQKQEAIRDSIPLWLSGNSSTVICTQWFNTVLKNHGFDHNLLTQRLVLALNQRNLPLAYYILKHYDLPRLKEIQTLSSIFKNPFSINKLPKNELSQEFYLYGLKRLVSMNMDKALTYWQQVKTKLLLAEPQQQAFLAHLVLYKAMRNHADTLVWLTKVKPQYANDVLMDWSIRYALKHKAWKQVSDLIQASEYKNLPCWQYWWARALEAQSKTHQAQQLYEELSKNRHYYGFLASIRLNKKPNFENEVPTMNLATLKPYQPIMDEVKNLFLSKQSLQASRLLNDFISELPKNEASALVYWVDTDLQWYGKSVYLSNNETLNDQLVLRFPLAYKDSIQNFSKQYAVPQEFVYAIIRQESGFRDDVTSSAGARGLMQLMPNTASVVSKMQKIAYKEPKQLFLWQKNINIGVAYLQQLGKRFSNHPVLIAAAYNAGPKQVVYWLKNHPPKEIDVWIETLPWQETRNYLKNVMAFYVVYQYRLKQKPDLKQFLKPL